MTEKKTYSWKDLQAKTGLSYKRLKRWIENNLIDEVKWPEKGRKTIFSQKEYDSIIHNL